MYAVLSEYNMNEISAYLIQFSTIRKSSKSYFVVLGWNK